MEYAIKTIIIDESGTLPDPRDRFIVVTGIVVENVRVVKDVVSRILKSLRRSKVKLKEIKFYYAGQNTKRQFLSGIVSAHLDIFALVIDKKGRKIVDSPENFALVVSSLIQEITLWHRARKFDLLLDRHFHRKIDRDKFDKFFNEFVSKGLTQKLNFQIKHVDSQNNLLVNTADMAAGSILWKYHNKDRQFYDIIKENIVVEKLVSWPEIKRKNLEK